MGYVGTAPLSGDYRKLDDISGTFNGDDNVTFNLTVSSVAVTPPKETTMLISVGGILQEPVTAYTISGSTITFTAAPATGADFFGILLGEATTIGTPADATITAAKVENTFISGQTEITSGLAAADEFLYSDGGTIKRVGLDTLADKLAGTNITATAGVLASASTAYTATTNGGIGLSGTAFSLDVDGMTDIGAGVATGDLFIVDDGAGGANRKTTVDRIATLFAGTGLTATNSVIAVDASQAGITTVGTIGTGVWEGTTVAVAQGGTGATSLSNLITLATHTTGDYVQNITAGTGLTSSGATSGENVAHSLSVDASQTGITSVGALNVGSITSGFTSIDVGAGAISTTGLVTAGSVSTGGSILIDSTPADTVYSGITASFTAGEALEVGEVVYLKAADSRVWKAVSVTGGTGLISAEIMCMGMVAVAQGSAGSAVTILLQGFLQSTASFPTYAVGETLYVPEAEVGSKNVPEGASPDTDGDFVQVVGWAAGADTVYFNPDFTIIEHA